MKIAILTRRAGFNMGTSLQAYAMTKFIEMAGIPNVIIDYDEYSAHLLWRLKPMLNGLWLSFCKRNPSLSRTLNRTKYEKLLKSKEQEANFVDFERQFLPLTNRRYRSLKSLEGEFDTYDACICGSDQIWNPRFFDPTFFLSFVSSENTTTIAYAPSIGITDEQMVSKKQRDLIKRMDYVSCREAEVAPFVSNIVGHPVPVVLDPTLMLPTEEWERMAELKNKATTEKYILTYFLHVNCYKDNIPYSYIKELKEMTGLPVYNVSLFNLVNTIPADKQFDTIGPLEFLSLVRNASWVCTNSYHCSIFSYIFKCKFFVFERYMKEGKTGANQNSRIHTLLNLFEMNYCLTQPDSRPNISLHYDFSQCRKNLRKQREFSLDFLLHALKNKR